MDYTQTRSDYIKKLKSYLSGVELSEKFMELLASHPCYQDNIVEIDKESRKYLIFTEYTKERDNCERLAQILENSGQTEPAKKLREYNTPIQLPKLLDNVELVVQKAIVLKSGKSRWFPMESIPRGKALIFVSVPELEREANRFASVFKQLYFDVEIRVISSCIQMVDPLKVMAKEAYRGDALIVMYIGHGYDEKIWIRNGDEERICNIVDIFSEGYIKPDDPKSGRKCHDSFDKIPKIFVFNCCRKKDIVTELPAAVMTKEKLLVFDMSAIDKNWTNQNTRTYICFTCAEDQLVPYDPDKGFTNFGQIFSHCIAQYACDCNLLQIFNKTLDRLEEQGQCPEIRQIMVTRDLYFNPGLPENTNNYIPSVKHF